MVTDVCNRLSAYVKVLNGKLKERFRANIPETLTLVTAVFDINKVTLRTTHAPNELQKIFTLSKDFGMYGDSELQYETFEREYMHLVSYMQEKTTALRTKRNYEKKDKDYLYVELLHNPGPLHATMGNILRLLSAATVMTSCEAIVECKIPTTV